MNQHLLKTLLNSTGAVNAHPAEVVQELWSGYGVIQRYRLEGAEFDSVIVKQVTYPNDESHPLGWTTQQSQQRKRDSYQVETHWYANWNQRCRTGCRTPTCFAHLQNRESQFIVLEDLDHSGFERRLKSATYKQMKPCIDWLANFHAEFLNEKPTGLWEIGTYWHLDTRPDEWQALTDNGLKEAAHAMDQKLRECAFQTLVHGDAKLANFCFSSDAKRVAAVDFQYVGGGCGMKDLAYFVGSCLTGDECEQHEQSLLKDYFCSLEKALQERGKLRPDQFSAIESAWRDLYPIAQTDFYRFIKGWNPQHWKINRYSERIAKRVIDHL